MEIIGAKLDLLNTCILGGVKMSREAMTDLLKFTFNLLVHYPKVRLWTQSSTFADILLQIVDCEAQSTAGKEKDSRLKGKSDEQKVMGDYWSHRLDGYVALFNVDFTGPE